MFHFISTYTCHAVTIYAQGRDGTIVSIDSLPIGLRFENAVMAYIKFLAKTLWPHDLAHIYPMPASVPFWQAICSLLALFFVSTATIWARRRCPSCCGLVLVSHYPFARHWCCASWRAINGSGQIYLHSSYRFFHYSCLGDSGSYKKTAIPANYPYAARCCRNNCICHINMAATRLLARYCNT